MLDKVKLALRIHHNYFDADIKETIETAKKEMIRAGVPESVARSSDELVCQAIKTYCLSVYANERLVEGYSESFKLQLDAIRKSTLSEG